MLSWSFGRVSNNSSTAFTTRSYAAPPVDVTLLRSIQSVAAVRNRSARVCVEEVQLPAILKVKNQSFTN